MGSIVLPLHQTPQHSLSEMASKLLSSQWVTPVPLLLLLTLLTQQSQPTPTLLPTTTISLVSMMQSTLALCSPTRRIVKLTTPRESTESTFLMVVFRLSATLPDPRDMLLM